MESSLVIRPNPRATYRELADGAGGVLLHLDTAEYYGVNEVGALTWSLLEQGVTFGELIDKLRAGVESPPAQLEPDIAEFIGELEARDLVRLDRPEGPQEKRAAAASDQP